MPLSAIGLLNHWSFGLCRYVWEEGLGLIEKGGWKKESKNHHEMAQHEMWRFWRKEKKSNAKVHVYNFNKVRWSGRTCYFGPQLKLGALGTVDYNHIDLSDERILKVILVMAFNNVFVFRCFWIWCFEALCILV